MDVGYLRRKIARLGPTMYRYHHFRCFDRFRFIEKQVDKSGLRHKTSYTTFTTSIQKNLNSEGLRSNTSTKGHVAVYVRTARDSGLRFYALLKF